MKNYLVVGGGGFIAGHLIKKLLDTGAKVRAVDIKPSEFWFQRFVWFIFIDSLFIFFPLFYCSFDIT